jgi:hypothetical protein
MSVPFSTFSAVVALVEQSADPALTDDEIAAAILRTAGYRGWAATTAYPFGALILPTVPNGWAYQVATPGTSGATEPIWEVPLSLRNPYARTADGTVVWLAAFPAGELYDVKAAAAECWLAKSRKVANRYDVSVPGGPNARRSQLYDHCVDMAKRLQPAQIF